MTVDSRIRELESGGPLRYGVHVYRATNLSVAQTTITHIPYSTAVVDTFGIWANATQLYRFRIPVGGSGLYLVRMLIQWDNASSVTDPQLGYHVYDATNVNDPQRADRGNQNDATSSATSRILQLTSMVSLVELEEIEPWVYHISAAARNVLANTDADTPHVPYFKMYRITR